MVGQILADKYAITGVLGEGGMGVVLAGQCVKTGRPAAIKVLSPVAHNLINLRRFQREAKTATALHHPNLRQVYDYGVLPDRSPFMAMELLSGETLRARLKTHGPFDCGQAVNVTLQLLSALTAVHEAGILHRDIKPGNVFLAQQDGATVVKLIDLGLAKVLPSCSFRGLEDEAHTITRVDLIPGTPSYLAPELITGASNIDARIDVWAAGLTLYELLTGSRAYKSSRPEDLLAKIVLEAPRPLEEVRPDIPAELVTVITKATAKQREVRFRTAGEFREALLAAWSRHVAQGIARGAQLRRGHRLESAPPSSTNPRSSR